MCVGIVYSHNHIMPSVARPTFFLGGPPLIKILDPPCTDFLSKKKKSSLANNGVFAFLPGPPDTRAPGRWPPLPPPSHRACVPASTPLAVNYRLAWVQIPHQASLTSPPPRRPSTTLRRRSLIRQQIYCHHTSWFLGCL